jgi:hypothetical protein
MVAMQFLKYVLMWSMGLVAFSNTTMASPEIYWGIAKTKDGKIAYTEKHLVTRDNGVIRKSETTYYKADRATPIASMVSDYSRSVNMPTYEFKDLRSGYKEGLRYQDGVYTIYNAEPKKKEESAPLSKTEAVFSCQGWHYYLIENLAKLEKQEIALNLILPSELDFYSFKIERVESTGDQVVANLELSSWLLSMFAPNLRLVYDKKQKKLVEYQGVSNILDSEGERQDVTIYYEFDGKLIK